ncbi:hypothetical protein THASP1DRAFT_29863 [Thamnocephalis sphaerospora]|uniref:Galactosyl transferase GMA12/MNN10 family-domain-containing protein n=1 Tax=Thamnocephalis sphaerospora TaxID=78915 RepID=A0A4P9XS29_9FUNG|nr:hypothetical protein THASP1DRAFT_29863 [Thamnocephalis sphaerospora]|eukprot:RKP08331.1 hypothetical protein THASP1DRAFT_29863 [Thamnocephalis sphaerospora]
MQIAQALLANRRLQFALIAAVFLFVLVVHLSTRSSTPTADVATGHADAQGHLAPQKPTIPVNHALQGVDDPEDPTTSGKDAAPVEATPSSDDDDLHTPRHYKQLLVIFSDYRDSERRRLLRRQMMGVRDNLQPCMRANGDVFYKFVVRAPVERPTDAERLQALRDYQAEEMEYGDILELKNDNVWDAQISMLRWIKELKSRRRPVSFDYLVYVDAYVYVRLDAYIKELDEATIAGQKLEASQLPKLLLGDVEARVPRIIIMGEATAQLAANLSTENTQPRDSVFAHFYSRYSSDNTVHVVNDTRLHVWQNAIEHVPNTTMALSNVFLTEDFMSIQRQFPTQPPVTCRRPMTMFNLALVTSAHLFPDNCMLDAGVASANAKREYASRYRYSFVARSLEYAQQTRHRHRHRGWGRLDVLEKVLPKYDWVLWTDMDAVIVNSTVRIFDLLQGWQKRLGADFSGKHLVATRLPDGKGIDVGVMLMRSSDWSYSLLRQAQERQDLYEHEDGAQRAIWATLQTERRMDSVLLLDEQSQLFSVPPSKYRPGAFIVHYAADKCPAEQVLAATRQIENGTDATHFKPLPR